VEFQEHTTSHYVDEIMAMVILTCKT